MEKQIFKKGDKVFDYAYGWGEVTEIRPINKYPISVGFGELIERYTFDGRFYEDSPQTLSFTEYTLNGFSQERPVELPEIGEEIMVSNTKDNWLLREVKEITNGKVYAGSNYWDYFKRLR